MRRVSGLWTLGQEGHTRVRSRAKLRRLQTERPGKIRLLSQDNRLRLACLRRAFM